MLYVDSRNEQFIIFIIDLKLLYDKRHSKVEEAKINKNINGKLQNTYDEIIKIKKNYVCVI